MWSYEFKIRDTSCLIQQYGDIEGGVAVGGVT